jgi:hypothetical protein
MELAVYKFLARKSMPKLQEVLQVKLRLCTARA